MLAVILCYTLLRGELNCPHEPPAEDHRCYTQFLLEFPSFIPDFNLNSIDIITHNCEDKSFSELSHSSESLRLSEQKNIP